MFSKLIALSSKYSKGIRRLTTDPIIEPVEIKSPKSKKWLYLAPLLIISTGYLSYRHFSTLINIILSKLMG